MDIFGAKTKQLKQKISSMEDSIRQSFSKVKDDMDTSNAWLSYYYQKTLYFESQINRTASISDKVDSAIAETKSTLSRHSKMISELVDNMEKVLREISSLHSLSTQNLSKNEHNFHIEKISNEIRKIDQKVEYLSYLPSKVDSLKEQLSEHISKPHIPTEVEQRLDDIQEKLRNFIIKKSPKDKLIQKVTKNSHDYIKAMILSYIKKYEKISAFQLKEMIVEEQNLTSKSTFYRILEEIESIDEISTIHQGKEKIYLSKLKKIA